MNLLVVNEIGEPSEVLYDKPSSSWWYWL